MTNSSAADDLVSTVKRLWPDSPETLLLTRKNPRRQGQAGFLVVPNARRPRLMVPAGNRRAAAAAMRRFSAGLSLRDIAQRLSASVMLRTAGPTVFRDRILVSEAGDSLPSHLSAVLGQPVDVSLGIGPARANRKPILEVFNHSGESLAYVKVGDGPVATRNVQGEAAALATVAGRLGPRIEVPEVLYTGTWRDHYILVMSSLQTAVGYRPREQWQIPFEEMDLVAETFGERPAMLTETPLWHRMTKTLADLADRELRDRIDAALDQLAVYAGTDVLAVGCWHGDWTPWNMARRRDRLQLWDWERFEQGVPVGLDAIHYGVNAMTRKLGENTEAVSAGLQLANRSVLLEGVYLAAVTCRYAASAEDELGHLVKSRAWLMLRSLEEWLTKTSGG